MRLVRIGGRPVATIVLVLSGGLLLLSLVVTVADLPGLLRTQGLTLAAFVVAIALGEVFRLRMPSGRETAPLASAAALGLAFAGPLAGRPDLRVEPGVVVLAVAIGLALGLAARRMRGQPVEPVEPATRLLAASVAAFVARDLDIGGRTLWQEQGVAGAHREYVALLMALVALLVLVVEVLLLASVRSERQSTPWTGAVRDSITEAAPLTFSVAVIGPMIALMAPVLGLFALPAALVPLVMAYGAVGQYARNRETNRQLVATLSRLTEEGGYTSSRHAERVAELSVRMARVLGIGDADLRLLEYAALLHDLGQISLRDPIPDGATVLAAPSDQLDIAAEGARIIRRAETFEVVASYVEAQTTPYRHVREMSEDVPLASRIIKCANAFDDLSGGSRRPDDVARAMERIHLGLGYEYDPVVVDALTRVVEDSAAGRVEGFRADDRRVSAR